MPIKNIYLIALIPPKVVYEAAMAFKNDIGSRFNCPYTINVIPHITLIDTTIELPATEHSKLVDWFKKLPISQESFIIKLEDFRCFANNNFPVIYIHPVTNISLHSLQKEIAWNFKNSYPGLLPKGKFTPHMTVAYKDLSPDMFQLAWQEYKTKKYSATFEVDSFHLLQHDFKKWNIIETYHLRKP